MNEPTWRKSSYSASDSTCVEVADLGDGFVGVRDSKNPAAGTFRYSRAEMSAFLQGAKAGEFDDLS